MGKKDGNRKRKADEVVSDNEEEDAELQAELAAVLAARQEKKNVENGEAVERVTMYNKEGMLKCIEELDTGLPFAETLVVCEFHANIINENDDIEREVSCRVAVQRCSRVHDADAFVFLQNIDGFL